MPENNNNSDKTNKIKESKNETNNFTASSDNSFIFDCLAASFSRFFFSRDLYMNSLVLQSSLVVDVAGAAEPPQQAGVGNRRIGLELGGRASDPDHRFVIRLCQPGIDPLQQNRDERVGEFHDKNADSVSPATHGARCCGGTILQKVDGVFDLGPQCL